jgi:hypothetical protein
MQYKSEHLYFIAKMHLKQIYNSTYIALYQITIRSNWNSYLTLKLL